MSVWDEGTERELTSLIARVVTGDEAAWRSLMVALAPRFEDWAQTSRVLRRCRLATPDDARAVMVDAFERMVADDHANLRRFLAHQDREAAPDDLVGDVVRLGKLDDEETSRPDPMATPLRGWLLNLVDFAARDHVRRRLGWSIREGEPSKRALHTDAQPLANAPEPAARPPLTDRLTMSKLVAEVRDHITSFPADMRAAVLMWLDDVEYDAIASQLAVDGARARALVRAGQARLRERFRGRSPLLFA